MTSTQILSVETSVPEFSVQQSAVRDFAESLFRDTFKNDLDRLLPLFENTEIEKRHFVRPLEWFETQHDFPESNALFEMEALKLSCDAAQKAISSANVKPEDIGLIVVVSTTGIATPSLDSKLIQLLKLSPNTARLPVFGLGCAGGAAGLARAAELSKAFKNKAVLFIAVELCSVTFQKADRSKSNLVATSLFADGAAAIVIKTTENSNGKNSLKILNSFSTLFENSEDVMGWDIIETGLKVRFARDIPSIITAELPTLLKNASQYWGIDREKIIHFVLHPGGAKVLKAYEASLHLTKEDFSNEYHVLKNYGNMSSPSVLFVLKEFLKNTQPSGDFGVLMALGPGFSCEQVLFQW
jgi:alkylresorcinol/alkylpyrone synthase